MIEEKQISVNFFLNSLHLKNNNNPIDSTICNLNLTADNPKVQKEL